MPFIKYLPCLLAFLFCLCCQDNNKTAAPSPNSDTSVETPAPSATVDERAKPKKTILFFGNSLTAGLGVDPRDAFVGLIGKKLESLQMPYEVVNSGVSGETTAGGLGRIDWILEQYQPAVFILELGGNDALRGVDPTASKQNLQGIIDVVRKKYPDIPIVLSGMEAPPNMGESFRNAFRQMYRDLAQKNNLKLIPFGRSCGRI
jgi:acyl-CoA thioesterase I